MGRTKLRGIELAGVRIAIEAPSWCDWSWPDAMRACECLAADPDVYLSLRRGEATFPNVASTGFEPTPCRPTACKPRGGVCEVARSGDGWVIAAHGGELGPRLARFDAELRYGEIEMSPRSVAHRSFPIAYPLGGWIVALRAVRSGGLVIWGSVAVRRGRGLVFLGDHAPLDLASGCRGSGGWLVLQPHCEGVRVCALESVTGRDEPLAAAWVEGVHTVDSILSDGCAPAVLDAEGAAAELLRYSFSPTPDADDADQATEAAGRLAGRISVIRTGVAGAGRFAWQRGRTGTALDAIGI